MGPVSQWNDATASVAMYRQKLDGIFDLHKIRTGSPIYLNSFLHRLRSDRYFAMDFWGLVESLDGSVPVRQMQQTAIETVAGESVREGDPALLELERDFTGGREENGDEPLEWKPGFQAPAPEPPSRNLPANRWERVAEEPQPEPFFNQQPEPFFNQQPEPQFTPQFESQFEHQSAPQIEQHTVQTIGPQPASQSAPQPEPSPPLHSEWDWPEAGAAERAFEPAAMPLAERPGPTAASVEGVSRASDGAGSLAGRESPAGITVDDNGLRLVDLVLARLESTNNELKQHLASIDSRMRRLEHLEELAEQAVRSMGQEVVPVAPAQAVPAQVVPAQAVPAQVVPAQVVPAQVVSAQVLPDHAVPAQPVPAHSFPAEAVSVPLATPPPAHWMPSRSMLATEVLSSAAEVRSVSAPALEHVESWLENAGAIASVIAEWAMESLRHLRTLVMAWTVAGLAWSRRTVVSGRQKIVSGRQTMTSGRQKGSEWAGVAIPAAADRWSKGVEAAGRAGQAWRVRAARAWQVAGERASKRAGPAIHASVAGGRARLKGIDWEWMGSPRGWRSAGLVLALAFLVGAGWGWMRHTRRAGSRVASAAAQAAVHTDTDLVAAAPSVSGLTEPGAEAPLAAAPIPGPVPQQEAATPSPEADAVPAEGPSHVNPASGAATVRAGSAPGDKPRAKTPEASTRTPEAGTRTPEASAKPPDAGARTQAASVETEVDGGLQKDGTARPWIKWYGGSHGGAGGSVKLAEAEVIRSETRLRGTDATLSPPAALSPAISNKAGTNKASMIAAGTKPAGAGEKPSTPGGGDTPPVPAGKVAVSAGAMEANLLASLPPDYPKLARLTHVEGPVVMRVSITSEGMVDSVRTVKGPRILRSAAEAAVRQWRYRPYVVDGRAVEVATTITLDFKLEQ